jgi:predicted membrane metal-binding protein
MKTVLPLLGAGTAFASTVIAGLLAGIWLDRHFGTAYWVLLLLAAGFVLGAWSAWRLVARSLSS